MWIQYDSVIVGQTSAVFIQTRWKLKAQKYIRNKVWNHTCVDAADCAISLSRKNVLKVRRKEKVQNKLWIINSGRKLSSKNKRSWYVQRNSGRIEDYSAYMRWANKLTNKIRKSKKNIRRESGNFRKQLFLWVLEIYLGLSTEYIKHYKEWTRLFNAGCEKNYKFISEAIWLHICGGNG